jgi:hypothetical protein
MEEISRDTAWMSRRSAALSIGNMPTGYQDNLEKERRILVAKLKSLKRPRLKSKT